MESHPGITGIGQVALHVADVARATAFYRDILGLPYLFSAPPAMAFFQVGEVRLLIGEPESDEAYRSSPVLYYRVPDIRSARALLGERGVQFEQEPHLVHRSGEYELWIALFRDSEGNLAALLQEKGRAAP